MNIDLTTLQTKMSAMSTLNREILVACKTNLFQNKGIDEGDLVSPIEIAEGLVYLAAFGRHCSRIILSKLMETDLHNTESKRIANQIDSILQTYCSLTFHLLYPEMDEVRYKTANTRSQTKTHFDVRPWVTEGMRAQKATVACSQEIMRKLIPSIYKDISSLESMILKPGFEFMLYLLLNAVSFTLMPKYDEVTDLKTIDAEWRDAIKLSGYRPDIREDLAGSLPSEYSDFYVDAFPSVIEAVAKQYEVFSINNKIIMAVKDITEDAYRTGLHTVSGAMVKLL